MAFNLFRKKKQQEQEKPAVPPQETPKQEEALVQPQEEPNKNQRTCLRSLHKKPLRQPLKNQLKQLQRPQEQKQEVTESPSKTYLKAMPLRELSDLENIKNEVKTETSSFYVLHLLQAKASKM